MDLRPGIKVILFFFFNIIIVSGVVASQARAQKSESSFQVIEEGFRQPPRSAGVRCFWWWLNGNVTKGAITRDLEQMKAKGFSGALIVDAGGAEKRNKRLLPA